MPTRMIHQLHGAMYAYDTGEVERLVKLGWSAEGAPQAKTEAQALEPKAPFVVERKKPGRPPKVK
jgi:hypothetical protein